MDVPPFIRVSLQVCDGLEHKLSKFVRVGVKPLQNSNLYSKNGLEEEESEWNPLDSTDILKDEESTSRVAEDEPLKTYTLQRDGLYSKHIINCNVDEVTNYTLLHTIDGMRVKGDEQGEWHMLQDSDYLLHNLKNLSERNVNKVKLRSKLVKILTCRILSIKDHFSSFQLAKLIFSLCNSDLKFAPVIEELCEAYLEGVNGSSSVNESVEYLGGSVEHSDGLLIHERHGLEKPETESITRHLLVLSSISLHRKNTNALVVRGPEPNTNSVEELPTKECTVKPSNVTDALKEIETKLLSLVESEINGVLSKKTILLSLQTMVIYDGRNEKIVRKLIQVANVNDFEISELCTLMHSCTLLSNVNDYRISETIESALERMTKMVREGAKLPTRDLSQMFHFFYLSGKLEHELMDEFCKMALQERIKFENNTEFYRTAFPLAVSNKLSLPDVCKWILHEMASNSDRYISDISQFLFMLTSIGNAVKLEKSTETMDFEDDIYEKALMYLKGSFHFPSNKSALKHLFEKAMDILPKCTSDQFVQLTQAFTHPLVKRETRLKLQLLKECRSRVDSVNAGGILHVVEFILWLYGKNPDALTAVNLYKEKALSDITAYNVGGLVAETTIYMDSFLTDVSILSNLVYLFNWCDLNSPDFALEVATLISTDDCKMIANATLGQLSQIFHYLACSMPKHQVYDVLAIMIFDRLVNSRSENLKTDHSIMAKGDTFYPEELILILEALLATSLAPRHKRLLEEVERLSLSVTGSTKVIKTLAMTLSKVTNKDYIVQEDDVVRIIAS